MNRGFGNIFYSEAVPDTLPQKQNSPQKLNHHLYAEQISGSAFTRPRHQNLHTWVYRLQPSVAHTQLTSLSKTQWLQTLKSPMPPQAIRILTPQSIQRSSTDFIRNVFHIASSGQHKHVYWYQCDTAMHNEYVCNQDGELIFIPYHGKIFIQTELGDLNCQPGQFVVIPRGICFKISPQDHTMAAGYLAENGGLPLKLPELGIMGAHALAYPRHFLYPQANFESQNITGTLHIKFQNHLWEKPIDHSPFNVVAWHGNYLPYFYDCQNFSAINSVNFDHPDPSIFTLLSSESSIPGIANLDLVIFPERLSVARHSFRLPYFHKNVMSELMGLIQGHYDAKAQNFTPGSVSIHNCMTPHGPDYVSWKNETSRSEDIAIIENCLAFMLESNEVWNLTEQAYHLIEFQKNYTDCWKNFPMATLPSQ